jgi:hypothetical protein
LNLLGRGVLVVCSLLRRPDLCGFAENLDLDACQLDASRDQRGTYVELPPLYVLTALFAGDDDDEFGYFASVHPVLELRHDLLDIRLDLIIGSNCVCQWWGARHTGSTYPSW